MANQRILVISDTHAPYQHVDALKFLAAIKKKYKPDRVIHIGDEVDKHALSFHDSDPDLPSAGDELIQARRFIHQLEDIYPKVDVMESNHGSLVYRKAKAHGIPVSYLRSYEDVLFPDHKTKWRWHDKLRVTLPNGSTCLFTHSVGASYLLQAQKRGESCVQGHWHGKFGIQYWHTSPYLRFSMSVACLIDDDSLAFAYNKLTTERPIVGSGMIIDSQPMLIPMVLKANGRWNGRLT